MADPDAHIGHDEGDTRTSECVAVRRAERWAAVVPGEIDVDVDLPSPEDARAAVLARGGESHASGLPHTLGARLDGAMSATPEFETILYGISDVVATITLNRPERLNTIVPPMPDEVEAAVGLAVRDPEVKVIVIRGAGRAFCAGYDFGGGFEHWGEAMMTEGQWDPGKDFAMATAPEIAPTQKFMAIWRSPKPVIAQVHGYCVGGGSDFALCADLVVASEDAVIGTPYSRMWGAYLSGMWIYRLGLARTKFHALTGRPLNGRQAADVELINEAVPFAQLEDRVAELAAELATIPSSQLAAMKLVVNHAYENMGLASTQTLGPILDGLMRNTPDALDFIETAKAEGVSAVAARRDGPFGDYSQAPPELRPDPANVIVP